MALCNNSNIQMLQCTAQMINHVNFLSMLVWGILKAVMAAVVLNSS